MSLAALKWAIELDLATPSAKSAITAIANFANEDGLAWPKQETIARLSSQSVDTVQRRLIEFADGGIIRRVPLRLGGRRSIDFFVLPLSPLFDASIDELTPYLPRGFVVDPSYAESACRAQSAPVANPSLPQSAAATNLSLPQTLPQNEPDATALVRQHEPLEPSEPFERDARARGVERKPDADLAALKAAWPTTALDDQARVELAWQELTREQRKEARNRVQGFLDELKAQKRTHCPALWKYLEERRFEFVKAKPSMEAPSSSPSRVFVATDAPQWPAWAAFYRFLGKSDPPTYQVEGKRGWSFPSIEPPLDCRDQTGWRFIERGTPQFGRWRGWLEERGFNTIGLVDYAEARHAEGAIFGGARMMQKASGALFPDEWPPRKEQADAGA